MRAVYEDRRGRTGPRRAGAGGDRAHPFSARQPGRSMARRLALIAERWGEPSGLRGGRSRPRRRWRAASAAGPVASPKLGRPSQGASRPGAQGDEAIRGLRAGRRRGAAALRPGARTARRGHLGRRAGAAALSSSRRWRPKRSDRPPSADGLLEHPAAGVVRGYCDEGWRRPPPAWRRRSRAAERTSRLIADRTPDPGARSATTSN